MDIGRVAIVIPTSETYRFPRPEIPANMNGQSPFHPINDPYGIARTEYTEAYKEYVRISRECKTGEQLLYALLWCNCSRASKEKIESYQLQKMDQDYNLIFVNEDGVLCMEDDEGASPSYELWQEVKLSQDVLSLVRRIKATHFIQNSGVSKLDKVTAERRYNSIVMESREDLLSYANRRRDALEGLMAVGATIPPESDQVIHFWTGLDDSRFAAFKADWENGARRGVLQYPKTVPAAYAEAERYKVPVFNPSTGSAVGTAFAASMMNPHAKGKTAHHSDVGKQKSASTPAASSSKKSASTQATHSSKVDKKDTRQPPGPCYCGELHWRKDCPRLAALQAEAAAKKAPAPVDASVHSTFSVGAVNPSGSVLHAAVISSNDDEDSPASDVSILLDNQADVSIFKDSFLLTNVREAPVSVTIGGVSDHPEASFTATEIGDFRGFKNIYISAHATANIISFHEAQQYCQIDYFSNQNFFSCITPDGLEYRFLPSQKHYVYRETLSPQDAQVYNFTSREVAAAKQARSLTHVLGYPSPGALIKSINNGSIVDCPVTAQDVSRSVQIFGADLASVRGKTTKRSIPLPVVEFLPREVRSSLVLHVDIMFIDGLAFLISVSTPLHLTMVTYLGLGKGSRALGPVSTALFEQLDKYSSRRFDITMLLTDGEGALVALSNDLNARGISVNPVGAGAHVPEVERKIREIKEGVRGILNTLPYRLPLGLLVHLVYFIVSRRNLISHRVDLINISPFEAFNGRKINFKRDLRVGFGDYCEIVDRYSDNSMRPRTQPAIALYPTGNISGSVKFYSLTTGHLVTRDQFTVRPITQQVIDQLNSFASAKGAVSIAYGNDVEIPPLFNDDAVSPYVDALIPVDREDTVDLPPSQSSLRGESVDPAIIDEDLPLPVSPHGYNTRQRARLRLQYFGQECSQDNAEGSYQVHLQGTHSTPREESLRRCQTWSQSSEESHQKLHVSKGEIHFDWYIRQTQSSPGCRWSYARSQ